MAENKKVNSNKAFGKFFAYIGKHKEALFVSVALSIIGSALTLIGPGKVGDMTNLIKDGLTDTMDIHAIVKIAILLAVIYILGFIINYVQGFIMATVTQRITQRMRRGIKEN